MFSLFSVSLALLDYCLLLNTSPLPCSDHQLINRLRWNHWTCSNVIV